MEEATSAATAMMAGGATTATAGHHPNNIANPTGTSTVLRPVIFVVDATIGRHNHNPHRHDDDGDEPFDVRRGSITASEMTDESGGGSVSGGVTNEYLFDSFLAALQGKQPGSNSEEVSVAASYASSAAAAPPFSPGAITPGGGTPGGGGSDWDISSPTSPSGGVNMRFTSPFSRFRKVGRWKASSPVGGGTAPLDDDNDNTTATTATNSAHHAIAHDMENDPDDNTPNYNNPNTTNPPPSSVDNISTSLNSYSKGNPPVHFMSKRARIVSVSRRHAFPPSKFPQGKMDHASSVGSGNGTMVGEHHNTSTGSGNWMSSYEIQNEGILPSGWLEKHARALPSALLVVATLRIANEDGRRAGIKNAVGAVEDLRCTLAEKRGVPIHLVCLIKEEEGAAAAGEDTNSKRGGSIANKRELNAIRETICQECYLPQSQVFLLKFPTDLEPDEFEAAILQSPYLDKSNVAATQPSPAAKIDSTIMINPLLRQLDRSLRDTSASYYSRLAESHERKLLLWRNRYHNTNASFEVNTLMAAMRCARYAIKVGTLREFQMRTGGGGGAGTGQTSGGGGRWTEKGSSAMRHYDEAYRWVMELHRRAISWRMASISSSPATAAASATSSFSSPTPITPGPYSMVNDIASPKLIESPGGGMGVELSFPGTIAPPPPTFTTGLTPPPPPPPMRRNSPALTSKKGYHTAENIAFFALLWEQCRAVASILNSKLLRSTTTNNTTTSANLGAEAEEQWSRHRLLFLATPQGMHNFDAAKNDEFFGPAWHRFLYITEELLTFACIAEGRWRKNTGQSSSTASTPSYHQPAAAPWKAYGELSEAMLGLRKVVKLELEEPDSISNWPSLSSGLSGGRRKFVGSIVSGGSGYGTMGWQFENESKHDHRAMALDYVLHALDLLDENISLCSGGSSDANNTAHQPNSSARLHYLAARLLMSLGNPTGAIVHLKIAADQTKSWASLHLSIQRALLACEERCVPAAATERSGSVLPNTSAQSKNSCIELLLRSDSCKLLSPKELSDAQTMAWNGDKAVGLDAPPKEIIWNHDDDTSNNTKPPFEFAVSFLKSTHATSSDIVTACVSIKSCLDFQVCIESMQLLTTSGTFDVSNLELCATDKKSLLQSCLLKDAAPSSSTGQTTYVPNRGFQFNSNDLAFFLTEISLPSNLSDIAFGGSSADTSKFIPKNGRLCNTGLSHAAGNICESRFENEIARQKISINGKPIATSSISETSSSFLGGIPLVCHGVVLTLKRAGDNGSSPSSLKLQIERPRLISPLLRSGTQRLIMEECNYTAHSWSRPIHHPWCLGPRVLRVLGSRPQMHVTNLSDPQTNCKAVEGTVNRIMLKLKAGGDEDCWDVRVRLKCESSIKPPQLNESADDAAPEGGLTGVDPHRMPTFVQMSVNSSVKNVTENGVVLPEGWETRKDVGSDEIHSVTTTICPHLGAGKSLLFPVDVFRPLDQSLPSQECDASTCSTSYDIIIMYRQVRVGKGTNQSDEPGDQVMVMQSGSIEWMSPFTAEFSLTNGPKTPYPCGIQHASNNVVSQSPADPSLVSETELIAANGERVQMRCSLEAKGLGSNIAASIIRVTNENETIESQKVLYSSESGLFMNQTKQGSKLSLSYAVSAQKDIESGYGNEAIPLGVISVNWKPVSLPLLGIRSTDTSAIVDEFGSTHGPLSLTNLTPMIFYGPQCQVLHAPFKAKLLKCPSMPKVGTPFGLSYQVTNLTAKCQTLILSLNDAKDGNETGQSSNPQLLGAGKLKEEMQMAPFEERTFYFTFMSMVAGRVLRPSLTVSSGRHQTWVINETAMSSRYLFVMP